MLFYLALAVIGACLAKPLFLGVATTLKWFASMSGSQRFEKSIDDYNKLHEDTVDARNDSYAQLVVSPASPPTYSSSLHSSAHGTEPILRPCH